MTTADSICIKQAVSIFEVSKENEYVGGWKMGGGGGDGRKGGQTCGGSSNKSCIESEKASDAGDSRSSRNVRVLTHLKLKTFLQKLSMDSDEISITDFRIIFRSL